MQEGAFERNFACEVEATKLIKHISKSNPKSSKIPDYTHRAHVLRDVSHSINVHVDTRAKKDPIKAVIRWQS